MATAEVHTANVNFLVNIVYCSGAAFSVAFIYMFFTIKVINFRHTPKLRYNGGPQQHLVGQKYACRFLLRLLFELQYIQIFP
jgi:hypothetical protein